MKPLFTFFACCFLLLQALQVRAQVNFDKLEIDEKYLYKITTASGNEIVGNILHMDARELIVRSPQMGEVIIPKYEVTDIKRITDAKFNAEGEYIREQDFATRYFISTNGLPIEKGEDYVIWNLWGPDLQFGVGKNTSVGILTSWVGVPIIGSVKHSIRISESSYFGVGFLLGSATWAAPGFGLAVPYAALSFGNRRSNISFSAGYGYGWVNNDNNNDSAGAFLGSVGAMTQINNKLSFIFDSFIFQDGVGLAVPGLRIHNKRGGAFQFGFGVAFSDPEVIALPSVQWMKRF